MRKLFESNKFSITNSDQILACQHHALHAFGDGREY